MRHFVNTQEYSRTALAAILTRGAPEADELIRAYVEASLRLRLTAEAARAW